MPFPQWILKCRHFCESTTLSFLCSFVCLLPITGYAVSPLILWPDQTSSPRRLSWSPTHSDSGLLSVLSVPEFPDHASILINISLLIILLNNVDCDCPWLLKLCFFIDVTPQFLPSREQTINKCLWMNGLLAEFWFACKTGSPNALWWPVPKYFWKSIKACIMPYHFILGLDVRTYSLLFDWC